MTPRLRPGEHHWCLAANWVWLRSPQLSSQVDCGDLNNGSHCRLLFLWFGPNQEAQSDLYLNYVLYSCVLASFLSVILLEAGILLEYQKWIIPRKPGVFLENIWAARILEAAVLRLLKYDS